MGGCLDKDCGVLCQLKKITAAFIVMFYFRSQILWVEVRALMVLWKLVATDKALHFDPFSLIAQKQTAYVPLNAIVIHKCLSFYEQNLSLQVSSESYKR